MTEDEVKQSFQVSQLKMIGFGCGKRGIDRWPDETYRVGWVRELSLWFHGPTMDGVYTLMEAELNLANCLVAKFPA